MSCPQSFSTLKVYVPKSSSLAGARSNEKLLETNTESLYTSVVKGSDPLSIEHERETVAPAKVCTVASCPHVSAIKPGNTIESPTAGIKCGGSEKISLNSV